MTDTDIEMRLRNSLRELTDTTPLVNPDRPRERPTGAPVSAASSVGNDVGRRPGGKRPSPPERRGRPVRIVAGAVATAVAVAAFALAIAYGPGSSDRRASMTTSARVQAARHLAATVTLRAGDLPGWSGYTTPAPDPASAATVARCIGRRPPLSPPVAAARSKEFTVDNLTVYAQSYTYVMTTAAQAEQVTSLARQRRFPSCDASLERKAIAANSAATAQLSGLKVRVGPAPPGVDEPDSLTVTTTYATRQFGATGASHTDAHTMVVRSGRVVTDVVVSALRSAGPYPVSLFNRLAVTLSQRLAEATRTAGA